MLNCINTLLVVLPAISFNNRKVFNMNDLWSVLVPNLYIAAENLLDMLTFNSSKKVDFVLQRIKFFKFKQKWFYHKNKASDADVNKWFTNASRFSASLQFDAPLDDATSVDRRFLKDFIFRSIQCMLAFEKWEKLLSIALKFNAITK